MNNTSSRHHYLPVFYLRGFSKTSGLKIYNVQTRKFVRNGKEFSPESYFFERDANTIFNDGNKSDILETNHYSFFDDNVAKVLATICNSNVSTNFGVTDQEMPLLQHFVSLMYWRLPHRENEIKDLLFESDFLKDLGLKIIDKNGNHDNNEAEKLKHNSEFQKVFRYYNPLVGVQKGLNCLTPMTILATPNEFPYLCSDNPVIFEKNYLPKDYEDDFIFPISGNRLFIRTNKRGNFSPFLKLWVDILVYKQAVKYVSCTDEKYIDILEDTFQKNFTSIEHLKVEIFKIIK